MTGLDFLPQFLAASAISNVGPGLGVVIIKLYLIIKMDIIFGMVGRLVFAVCIIFSFFGETKLWRLCNHFRYLKFILTEDDKNIVAWRNKWFSLGFDCTVLVFG